MKKLFIILFVVSLFSHVQAQYNYGVEVGLNISTIKGPDTRKISGSNGILFGVNGQYELLDFLSVGTGLYLSQKGVTRSLSGTIQGNENYNYIEVPLDLFIKLPIPQSGNTLVFGGIYYDKLLSASVTPDNEGQSSAVNVDDMIRTNDFGFNVGIRQGFKLSTGMFNVGLQYSLGLVSLDKSYSVIKYGDTYTSDGSRKLNNSVFTITVGYSF